MTNAIQQLNITYEPVQDRLLLRASVLGEGEYRLWLTRRYAALLVKVLDEQINKAGGIHELASRKETLGLLKGGALERPYQGAAEPDFPLGEDGVLGFRINVDRTESGKIHLQLLPGKGKGLAMSLEIPLLYLIYNLLEQGIRQADWQLSLPHHDDLAMH
jgi:hypothetical protein